MSLVFLDNLNRKIRLTAERVKHIEKRMRLYDKIHIIEDTLKNPETISKDIKKENTYYYQKYLKSNGLYFIIVVKILNGEGFIITIFQSNKLKW